jgi:glycosyltransferase involved in cell wall biosynthesis
MGLSDRWFRRLERGVTVVVPAHNVERYLSACLDSVIAQTWWSRCRLIVVDDGSTDRTPSIADGYARAHPRVTVMHQSNAGPGAGAARNRGFDRVQTTHVLFLDGDDELTPEAVERLLSAAERWHVDLAVGATEQVPHPRRWPWSPYFENSVRRVVRIEDVPLLVHDARTCNKLYATRWLRQSGLRFAEGIHHQDTVVNVPAMLRMRRFALLGQVVHLYRKRAEGGSVMDSHFTRLDNYWDHLQVIEELASMIGSLRSSRRALMQAFIVRSFQGFARRAPGLLPSARLPEFFARARAVIRGIACEVIEQSTTGPDQRAAYVTMLENDYPSFERLDALAGHLRADRGNLYLAVPTTSSANQGLLQTGATRAWADDLQVSDHRLQFRLRLRIRGAVRLETALTGIVLRLVADSGTVAEVPVTVKSHADDPREHSGIVSIPLGMLADGRYRLRMGFLTDTGRTDRWVRRPPNAPDELVSGAGVCLRLATTDDRAELIVQGSSEPDDDRG